MMERKEEGREVLQMLPVCEGRRIKGRWRKGDDEESCGKVRNE